MTLLKNQKGQISIFFSASLIVLVSIIAFVINIGLFVKAKINLQNATDAAAFSGAAVQSRQLTKIAYLNWEMRNIYKEWMYKYYVIGNLNVKDVENSSGTGAMNFRLETDVNVLSGKRMDDAYNIPAVCIHIAGSQTNICKRYSVPGLPEFGSSELPGAEEASRAFMDTLISTKVNDCIDRTRLNMLVANTWTYNVMASSMDESLAGRGPAILADRQGAWPRAVELGMRIRNLEFAMNRKAEIRGVCSSGSSAKTNCKRSINDIIQEKNLGNERLIKAFYSGYRNLGNDVDSEMKDSFTLTEIPPKGMSFTNHTDASYLLVPKTPAQTYEKQWVDLKLMMVNYAIFYAAMIPRADSATSGACDVTKVAIPVPGYPMGFYKNPDIVTYYAVRGEAEFVGMFNPFSDSVKMTAYSAAKPMGGRIGPMLFVQKENQTGFYGRTDSGKLRSIPYIASLNLIGAPTRRGPVLKEGEFEPGVPLPINSSQSPGPFWLSSPNSQIGGLATDSSAVEFGIPNMPYDYDSPFTTDGYSSGGEKIHTIKASIDKSNDLPIGLFSKTQFNKFRGSNLAAQISPQTLDEEIARVRAPTHYEAANYLIPTPNDFNLKQGLDSFGFIPATAATRKELSNGIVRYETDIYAPLHRSETDQQDILFDSKETVKTTIYDFMRAQKSGMNKYKLALNQAARAIYAQKDRVAAGATGSQAGYIKAASGVSDIDFNIPNNDQNPKTCASIAGQFLYFYYGDVDGEHLPSSEGCPEPLGRLIEKYFAGDTKGTAFSSTHYHLSYSWPKSYDDGEGLKMLSAYAPGAFTGVGQDARFSNPIPGSEISEVMRRNFYSTKFVALDSLRGSEGYNEKRTNFVIYSEGEISGGEGLDRSQNNFKNSIDPAIIGSDLDSIKY